MTFADELYKYDLDPYEKEKMFVHNLFIVECIKVAMSKNRQSRQFNWACCYYSEDYGDSYHLLSPDHPTGFWESSYSNYNWSVIKSLIENEVKKGDLGLRNFTITITDERIMRPERDGNNIFGKPKYKKIPDREHQVWIRAYW